MLICNVMEKSAKRERVAVVGGGVAGVVSALMLQDRFDVTLFERNDYVGGHTQTIKIPSGPDAGTPVDVGFIVLNNRTYPLFQRLLERLDVSVRPTDMSFGFWCAESGLQYAGTSLSGLFAQRSAIVSPSFWRFIYSIRQFCRDAEEFLRLGCPDDISVAEFAARRGYSKDLCNFYLFPMTEAIWSCSEAQAKEYPARSLISFYSNHGLLSLKDRPQWYTVVGGSQSYIRAFQRQFPGSIRTSCPVQGISRSSNTACVHLENEVCEFDYIIMAAHADETLALLRDPSAKETEALGVWQYAQNSGFLHTDISSLPPNRRAWGSWNVKRELGNTTHQPVSITYNMNRLQGLTTERTYCVTLNSKREIPEAARVASLSFSHPIFSAASVRSQAQLKQLSGERRTFFCGSYFGYGFHEDAVRSAVAVGEALGGRL